MRNLILAAGVAAIAIAAPAAAKPDKGGGGGHGQPQAQQGGQRGGGGGHQMQRGGGGGGQHAFQQRGGGGGERRQFAIQRGGGGDRQAQRMERHGGGQRMMRMEHGNRQAQRVERRGNQQRFANFQSNRNEKRAERVENHGNRNVARVDMRGRNNERFEARNHVGKFDRRMAVDNGTFRDRNFGGMHANRDFANIKGDQDVRFRNIDDARRYAVTTRDDFRRHDQWRDWNDGDWDRRFAYRGLPAAYVGCPPGLAKKLVACVPPGLAQSAFVGMALPNTYSGNVLPLGLRDLYYDTPDYYYRYGDGYAYRVNRSDNLISALLPLIGAGYGVGQVFPYYQQPSYYVPSTYQSFYRDTPYDYYRYDDGYVYQIDAGSGLIEDVIPLLDRGYGVGQMLPAGYSYYNVPDQYRDYYYDTDDYYYRYAPGAIYQVDRDSQLITSIASLLTGGLSVGQPLPASYSVYNVPISYRDRYYDTPENWYRYSDGYIYQVDPTTQLITAMVQALV